MRRGEKERRGDVKRRDEENALITRWGRIIQTRRRSCVSDNRCKCLSGGRHGERITNVGSAAAAAASDVPRSNRMHKLDRPPGRRRGSQHLVCGLSCSDSASRRCWRGRGRRRFTLGVAASHSREDVQGLPRQNQRLFKPLILLFAVGEVWGAAAGKDECKVWPSLSRRKEFFVLFVVVQKGEKVKSH